MTSWFERATDGAARPARFVSRPLDAASHREPRGRDDGGQAAREDAAAGAERLEQERRRAYGEGHAAGRAELPWSEAEQLETTCAALGAAVRALDEQRRDYLRAQRRALVDLALAIAGRLLGREIEADPKALARIVQRAIARLPRAEQIVVHLAPRDHAVLAAGDAPLLERLGEAGGLGVASDPELAPGDARVEAGAAEVDARLASLLARVGEALGPVADADPGGAAEAPASGREEESS